MKVVSFCFASKVLKIPKMVHKTKNCTFSIFYYNFEWNEILYVKATKIQFRFSISYNLTKRNRESMKRGDYKREQFRIKP